MKRFILATLALFVVALTADANDRVVRQRVVNRGAVIARGVARAVGFGLGFRSPLGFGYGHQALVQPFVGQQFYGQQLAVASIVQPVQAFTQVQSVVAQPVVQQIQTQSVVGDCAGCVQAFAAPVLGVSAVHGYGVQRIVRQRAFVGVGHRAFLGGGLYGGFGRLRLFR